MTKKRILSFVLCLCMLLSLAPTQAAAATKISTVSITIETPVAGALPNYTGSVADGEGCYVDSIEWYGVFNSDGTYRAGETYQLKLFCKINEGSSAVFAFNSSMNVTLNNVVINGGDSGYWSETTYGKQYLLVRSSFTLEGSTNTSNEKVAISSESDLQKIIDNPAGSFYLTKDITISNKNTVLFTGGNGTGYFSGTFDGKNHSIKGYTYSGTTSDYVNVALFGQTSGGTFKNLTMKNVNINLTANGGCTVSALANGNATFSNVTVTGSIKVSGVEPGSSDSMDYSVAGINVGDSKLTKCTNKATITANCEPEMYVGISAVGLNAGSSTFNNCKNTGKITFKGHQASGGAKISGIGTSNKSYKSCTNSGAINVTIIKCKNGGYATGEAMIAGIGTGDGSKFTSCKNTGKITATNKIDTGINIAGVGISASKGSSKCANTASITAKTGTSLFSIAGVFKECSKTTQCYNTGNIKATTSFKDNQYYECLIGGVSAVTYGLSNCYNAGSVSTNIKCEIGGVTAYAGSIYTNKLVNYCYNSGKISAKSGCYYLGAIAGNYSGEDVASKRDIYDNYSSSSNKLYGTSSVSWKDWVAKGTKVSSITFSSCPKLSSKYWTYSSSKKRLILKNNKEK